MKEDTFVKIDFRISISDRLLEGQSQVAALNSQQQGGCSYYNGQSVCSSKAEYFSTRESLMFVHCSWWP